MTKAANLACAVPLLAALAACSSNANKSNPGPNLVYPDGSVAPTAICRSEGGTAPVAKPVRTHTLTGDKSWAETGWFSSPGLVDLNGDGKLEIVAPFYSLFVFDSAGNLLSTIKENAYTQDRIYAPAVVADLDGDGVMEVVAAGDQGTVAAYEWKNGALAIKSGWPASTTSGGQSPEGRGMAAADIDGDGKIEVVVTTTNTSDTGAQVFVFSPNGKLYQPAGTSWQAWPRYNTAKGVGGDVDTYGQGQTGYGCYGLNVGIGNIDDDSQQEIIVTYDNHQINAFKPDGTSITASSYFTNPANEYLGNPMTWGQFIRWVDPVVEENHYHLHTDWPDIKQTMWLQWTASPPSVADLDGDGKNEVIGLPNAEMHDPYVTQGYAFTVLQGAYGDGSRSAMRLPGWETLPMSSQPAPRGANDYYPPDGVPAPAIASILGDSRPEIVATINDGAVYAYGPDAQLLWRYDYAKGAAKTFASEPAVVDLNRDGVPEIVFGTYSLDKNGGRLVVLDNTGQELYDITLENQGDGGGNGIGVPAAPSVADIDGDGNLEIVLLTFDHGVDIYTVPGSGTQCLPWPTGRGNLLRNGQGPTYVR